MCSLQLGQSVGNWVGLRQIQYNPACIFMSLKDVLLLTKKLHGLIYSHFEGSTKKLQVLCSVRSVQKIIPTYFVCRHL